MTTADEIREADLAARVRRVAEAQARLAIATHAHARELARARARFPEGRRATLQGDVMKAQGAMMNCRRDFDVLWARLCDASPAAAEVFRAQAARQLDEAEALGELDGAGGVVAAHAAVADSDDDLDRARADAAGDPFPAIEQVVRAHIERAMARFGGNKVAAARALGISLKTLYNKLHAYEADAPRLAVAP